MYNLEPRTATQAFLASLAQKDKETPEPITRKEKFLNDFRQSLHYQFINDISELKPVKGQKINNNSGSIGNILVDLTYLMFGDPLIYVKKGSKIELIDTTNYMLQFAKYDKNSQQYIEGSLKDTSSANSSITIEDDCYIRFCIKNKNNQQVTDSNIEDYLNAVKISLILDKPIIPEPPFITGTYTLQAIVDSNGDISYNWVSQQS